MEEEDVFQCEGCGRTLPAGTITCQFCGATVGEMVEPTTFEKLAYGQHPWKYAALRLFGVLWIVNGILVLSIRHKWLPLIGQLSYVHVLIGVLYMATGFGLLFRMNWARGVANVCCWLLIVYSLFQIWLTITVSAALKASPSPMFVILEIVRIFFAAFQVWILAETE